MITVPIVEPHPEPIDKSTFVSSYDTDYYRKWRLHPLGEVPTVTGHLSNTGILGSDRGLGEHASVFRRDFARGFHPNSTSAAGGAAHLVRFDRFIGTAHTRDGLGPGSQRPLDTISLMKDSYGDPSNTKAPSDGRRSHYAGDFAVRYNPDFLRVDEPNPKKKETPKPMTPKYKWRSVRDGTLNFVPGIPLEKRAWTSQGPRPPVSNARLPKTLEDTGASRMGGMRDGVGAAPGGLLDGTTEYRDRFVNQWDLPEAADGSWRKGKKEDTVRLDKNIVSYSAAKALFDMRQDNGKLVPERPELVHPSVWSRAVRQELADIGEAKRRI